MTGQAASAKKSRQVAAAAYAISGAEEICDEIHFISSSDGVGDFGGGEQLAVRASGAFHGFGKFSVDGFGAAEVDSVWNG
jgi:hypothetical protein